MGQPHKPGLNAAAVKMRKNFPTQLIAAAIVPVAAFLFSYTAQAINIGEVVSQSKLGEPLRTQIELTVSGNEIVEDSCLSLVAPDPNEEGARDFLTAAKLAVKTEGKQQFAVISSHRPYNDPFIRIKLRVRCAGVGNVVKSFTILPDFAEVLTIAAPVVAAEASSVAVAGSSVAGRNGMASGASPSAERDILSERAQTPPRRSRQVSHAAGQDVSGEAGQPAATRRSHPARTAPGNQGKTESFRLRLSGDSIDESRIGKISQEERSLLLARQKLLDADDQMASFLALQHQVKQLQAELGMVKLKLGQLGVSSPGVTPSVAPAQVAPAQEIQPQLAQQPSEATAQPSEAKPDNVQIQQAQNQQSQNLQPVRQRKPKIQRGPIIFGLLALLGLLLGLRYYMRIRAQSVGAKPILKRPSGAPAGVPEPAPAHAPAFKPAMQTKIAQPGAKPAAFKARSGVTGKTPAIAFPATQKMAEPSPVVSSPDHEKTQEELAEADSIIEEAELYAIHGHPDRAILILKELIQQHITKTEAWLLLFSIYSSLKKAAEFEKAARDFLHANKNSSLWPEIQALGRSLDPGNILYADFSTAGAAAAPQPILGKRALLGDILLAMGALSIQDMDKCLAEFDPKVDGRFGGFLIKRNMITEAQLDAALLQQQLNNEANTYQSADAPEPKNGMLSDLEFEPPAMDFPKISKSPESDQTPGSKPGGG